MKIAVIGAGAIGSVVAGYLKIKADPALGPKGWVRLVGSSESVKAIKENGLAISGVRGDFKVNLDTATRLDSFCGLAILAVKTQDIEKAVSENLNFLQDCEIITTQNGVEADAIVAKFIPKEKIISSIAMFGATYLEPGKVVHNFEGNWIIDGSKGLSLCYMHILKEVFPVTVSQDIRGMKYLKIFVNANNCIPAILGKSMQEVFSDIEISKIGIAIWQEGLRAVKKAGINLVSLPDFSVERLEKLTSLPIDEAAKIFSGIMSNLSKEPLYGSILQSIKRGRASEIDYINGEFARLAKENGIAAPLNEKLVAMVHEVERSGKFFTKEQLL